jgi:hypothetical protein
LKNIVPFLKLWITATIHYKVVLNGVELERI